MNFKKVAPILPAFVLAAVCIFSGCGNSSSQASADELTSGGSTGGASDVSAESDEMFTSRDKEIGCEESECETITLVDDASKSSLESVVIDGNTITITEEAEYIVTGDLSDGQIIIEGDKSEKIRLILDGVGISSSTSAPIYVKQTDKLFITLAEGSENTLANNSSFTPDGDTNVDAVIFSKEDLTLNGNGSLSISSNCGQGIVSKDDLKVTSGNYTVNSSGHCLCGKDSVRICGGSFKLTSDKDGIHSENSDDESLGFIYIESGEFKVTSEGDGLDSSAYTTIVDGALTVTSGGGASNAEKKQEEFAGMTSQSSSDDSSSAKGIKSDGTLTIGGGNLNLDCADDAIHSNSDITVTGGTMNVKSGDDGMHADNKLQISNGTVNITESYEGIEGLEIDVSGGEINVTASDDGFNAAGGNDESGFGGGMGRDSFASESDATLNFSGGKVTVDAQGDGLDSNGTLTVSGGEIYVTGPTNGGNGAIDYGSEATVTGGIVVAAGMSGMEENFGSSSTQGAILYNTSTSGSGEITLTDGSGNDLVSFTPSRSYNSVVVSCPGIEKGSTYTLSMAGTKVSIEMTDIIYGSGSSMGGDPGSGGDPGMGGGHEPGGM